jgi:hypothetical protein
MAGYCGNKELYFFVARLLAEARELSSKAICLAVLEVPDFWLHLKDGLPFV